MVYSQMKFQIIPEKVPIICRSVLYNARESVGAKEQRGATFSHALVVLTFLIVLYKFCALVPFKQQFVN